MTNVTNLGDKTSLTPRQQAEAEVASENRQKGVTLLKSKVRELDRARTIVANLEREIADIEKAIDQGNVPIWAVHNSLPT